MPRALPVNPDELTALRSRLSAARSALDELPALAARAERDGWWPRGGDPARPRARTTSTASEPVAWHRCTRACATPCPRADALERPDPARAADYERAAADLWHADRALARLLHQLGRGYTGWSPTVDVACAVTAAQVAVGCRHLAAGLCRLRLEQLDRDTARALVRSVLDRIDTAHRRLYVAPAMPRQRRRRAKPTRPARKVRR